MDSKVLEKVSGAGYFTSDKVSKKPGEESFFKQGEKPEVCNPNNMECSAVLTAATEEGDFQGPC